MKPRRSEAHFEAALAGGGEESDSVEFVFVGLGRALDVLEAGCFGMRQTVTTDANESIHLIQEGTAFLSGVHADVVDVLRIDRIQVLSASFGGDDCSDAPFAQQGNVIGEAGNPRVDTFGDNPNVGDVGVDPGECVERLVQVPDCLWLVEPGTRTIPDDADLQCAHRILHPVLADKYRQ